MNISLSLSRTTALLAVCAAMSAARAQDAPPIPAPDDGAGTTDAGGATGTTGAPSAASRVYVAEENALASLPGALARAGAVSLRASEAAFAKNTAARTALLAWVRGGGVVFLHTGAARAFGYTTVEARQGNNRQAGQLFGRARAALPFGAHPLLWDTENRAMRRSPNSDPVQLPGVNTVFYQMSPGDHLVESHPAGTPLLEVSDLASNGNRTVYAAAIAPFGRGWAVFTPDSIEQNRGDGAVFARNLLQLLPGARTGSLWVGIAAGAVEKGGTAPDALRQALLSAGSASGSSAPLPAFGTTATATTNGANDTATGDANATTANATTANATAANATAANATAANATTAGAAPKVETEGRVLLSRAEAGAYATLLGKGGDQAGAAINLLRARLFLSRGDVEGATRAVEAAAALAPAAAEVAFWRGVLAAGESQEINQPSPVRAEQVGSAGQFLLTAAGARSLLPSLSAPSGASATGTGATGTTGTATSAMLSGISLNALRAWSTRMNQIAGVYALEPPLVQQFGTGDAAITVRAVENDNSLRLVVPGATALANANNFGWRGDREEILVFPSPDSYLVYRRALGLNGATVPLPSGSVGDVVGQRIAMTSLPSLPVIVAGPNGRNRVLTTGNSSFNVLARLHAYVLLNALDEGGARVPTWLQLGVENLVNNALAGGAQDGPDTQILQDVARVGGLLEPNQFTLNNAGQQPIAQAQAAALMVYLYNQFGAGAVVETLQRLGSGQNIDSALQETTGNDQTGLFRGWRQAQFGGQALPNRG